MTHNPSNVPAELEDGDRPAWLVAEMVCAVCSREWVSVYPECAPQLECPKCGHMNRPPE